MALIRIITVGKLKEMYWQAAQMEYLKRLQPYMKLEIKEINDLPCPEAACVTQEEQVRQSEKALIEPLILAKSYLVVLDIQGKELSSPEVAQFLSTQQISGRDLTMVIGGSLGLAENLRKRADFRWSFSKLTFPHQMFRIILLEQLYRGCKIIRGEKYHK